MALDATVGGASANAYDTQANATTYFASGMHKDNAVWTALTSDQRDELLIEATMQIDMEHIDGGKYDTDLTSGVPDQRLRFPRVIDYDDGTTFVPLSVKEAMYEQAIWLAKYRPADTATTRRALQAEGVTRVKIGDVEEEYGGTRPGLHKGSQLCERAWQILNAARLLSWSSGYA